MWSFWIVAGLLAAASAVLVIARAGAAARHAASSAEDPAIAVYRRQLAELDGQASDGLLGADEHRAARAEAGRRLLRFADARARPERAAGQGSRIAALGAAVLAASLALGAYLKLGAPGLPDQPYASRLAEWRRADPATLDPPRMAAVLREIAKARPHDPQAYDYLGRAELQAGDAFDAGRAFASAAALAPGRADLRALQGEALVLDAQGKVTPKAAAAFRAALTLDPKAASARYYLARQAVAQGDAAGGVAGWRALLADMAPGDPRRRMLAAEIAQVGAGGSADATQASGALGPAGGGVMPPGPQAEFIHAMVARQAEELKANPNDPQGWARLVRSYGVLGDTADQQAALAQARRLFAGRPAVLAPIEAQAHAAAAG